MKNNIDWIFLRKSLIFLALSILIAALLIFAGLHYENDKYEQYQTGKNNLRTAHTLYLNMANDIDLLEQYTVKYSNYKTSGLVGGERRLSWVESLESTNSVLKLPTLNYNLLPQQGFARPLLKVERDVAVNSSPMALKMSLLHEEDLFALLDGLKLSISNLFTVDSCSIQRSGGVGKTLETRSPNLSAECVIRWISIDVKN